MQLKSLLGADISNVENIDEDYEWASALGYSFVLANIYKKADDGIRCFNTSVDSRCDAQQGMQFLKIKDQKISNCIVGKISHWIDLDTLDDGFNRMSEKALIEELQWSIFQGFPAVVIHLTKKHNPNLARVLCSFFLNEQTYFRIWLSIPMIDDCELNQLLTEDEGTKTASSQSTWSWWQEFSLLIGENISNFMVMLTLPKKLPVLECDFDEPNPLIEPWFAEPVSALKLPTDIFLQNRAGYPVLTPDIQDLVNKMFKHNVQIVISGEVLNNRGYLAYYQYIAHLWKSRGPPSIYDKNSKDMEDHLQDPLQPLADHLPSITYSIFELDPYKYKAYEESICAAIRDSVKRKYNVEIVMDSEEEQQQKTVEINENPDLISTLSNYGSETEKKPEELEDNQESQDDQVSQEERVSLESQDEQENQDKASTKSLYGSELEKSASESLDDTVQSYASVARMAAGDEAEIKVEKHDSRYSVVIMVLGAGRGPLVDAAFKAGARTNCRVVMHVVEKNPNAVSFLRHRMIEEWIPAGEDVTLHPGDMREVVLPNKADIFVSELLGSFGDNELSPECLDGAQKFLVDEGGISIPTNYTSYITPIQSTKLFNDMFNQKPMRSARKSKFASLETPYVVNLRNYRSVSTIEPVFTFEHPKTDMSASNDRYKKIHFDITENCVIHGFAGYFDSVLYDDIHMSIHPDNHSPDMFSWFPILFPIQRPLLVRAGDCLDLHMWRVSNQKSIWYEWTVTGDHILPVHNSGGRSYSMSLISG